MRVLNILFPKNVSGFFFIFLNILVSPKMNIIGLGRKSPIWKSQNQWGFLSSPISKSKSYKFTLNRNHSPELLNLLFPYIYHDTTQQRQKIAETFSYDFPVMEYYVGIWKFQQWWTFDFLVFGINGVAQNMFVLPISLK